MWMISTESSVGRSCQGENKKHLGAEMQIWILFASQLLGAKVSLVPTRHQICFKGCLISTDNLLQVHRTRFCFVWWDCCEGDLYNVRWFTRQQSRHLSWGCSHPDGSEVVPQIQEIESQGFLLSHQIIKSTEGKAKSHCSNISRT